VRPTAAAAPNETEICCADWEGRRRAGGLAGLRGAEEGDDDLVVHRAAHRVGAVLHVRALRVDQHAQLVRVVDQVVPVVVVREDPATIGGRVLRREVGVARGALGGADLADLVDRDGLLADVAAFHDGAAQPRALLLQQQLHVGRVLLYEVGGDELGHDGPSTKIDSKTSVLEGLIGPHGRGAVCAYPQRIPGQLLPRHARGGRLLTWSEGRALRLVV
jgi:hypothetical protein